MELQIKQKAHGPNKFSGLYQRGFQENFDYFVQSNETDTSTVFIYVNGIDNRQHVVIITQCLAFHYVSLNTYSTNCYQMFF